MAQWLHGAGRGPGTRVISGPVSLAVSSRDAGLIPWKIIKERDYVHKQQKKSSRMRMTNRTKKRHKQIAAYLPVLGPDGQKRYKAINRQARRETMASQARAPGRAVRQIAREKRKARLVKLRKTRKEMAARTAA